MAENIREKIIVHMFLILLCGIGFSLGYFLGPDYIRFGYLTIFTTIISITIFDLKERLDGALIAVFSFFICFGLIIADFGYYYKILS